MFVVQANAKGFEWSVCERPRGICGPEQQGDVLELLFEQSLLPNEGKRKANVW